MTTSRLFPTHSRSSPVRSGRRKVTSPDSGVVSQIKVIKRLFDTSEHIIVATDAGPRGRAYLPLPLPLYGLHHSFRAPVDQLSHRQSYPRGDCGNSKTAANTTTSTSPAKARSESDWLVGINGTQALSIAAGHGTYSVGRVQTPTLAMVCERYWENRRFTSEAFWQLHIATDGCDGEVVKFSSSEKWKEKEPAMELYNKVKAAGCATVTKAERKEKTEETPLLYDLTTLQKEANAKHGFTAEQTLEIAQKLYEKKLITYPRTGSRYIPEDVFAEIPKLLAFIGTQPEWKDKVRAKAAPTRRSVDDGKVTDHHALLVTGEKPLFLSKEDNTIYQMIAGRMVEAFSEKCVKDVTHCHGGMCRSGVYRKRQRREANRMACRLWRGKRGNYHPRLAGRRHADTERLVHYRRKDQTQAAAYRSHPALGNGNSGQGN